GLEAIVLLLKNSTRGGYVCTRKQSVSYCAARSKPTKMWFAADPRKIRHEDMMGKFGVGQAVRRLEDRRFLTGTGRFTDDIKLSGELRLYLLRSPYAHADLKSIDVSAAKAAPGVVGVLTGADLEALGVGGLPVLGLPATKDGVK